MKKESQSELELNEILKNTKSIDVRTTKILEENMNSENNFDNSEISWKNRKIDINKVMDSLKYDTDLIKKDISRFLVEVERIIIDFRNKSKEEKVSQLKRKIDEWDLEKFVTKKRFLELLEKEMLKDNDNKTIN